MSGGSGRYVYRSAAFGALVPRLVVTVTSTTPGGCAGVPNSNPTKVSVHTKKQRRKAGVVPNWTELTLVNPRPNTVRNVPPSALPDWPLRPSTSGACGGSELTNVKMPVDVTGPPPVVTVMWT